MGTLLILLLTVGGHLVVGQGTPFQVNTTNIIQTCDTNISLDTTTLADVARGDEAFPCSGYLQYTDRGKTRRLCGSREGFSSSAAQRACYTLGVSHYRSTPTFSASATRQIMLYRCFHYQEQNVDRVEAVEDVEVFDNSDIISDSRETGCYSRDGKPSEFDCFDSCYYSNTQPTFAEEDDCSVNEPFIALGCVDVNECENGVRDNCKGPFESSCTVRKACGNSTDCTNLPGSFQCTCKDGYDNKNGNSMDPYELDAGCKDVDECEESSCDNNAVCTNTPGSYSCTCRVGFSGDGLTCTALPCDPALTLPNAELQQPVPNAITVFGATTMYRCDEGFKVSVQNIPDNLVNYYGFTTQDSFTLTCNVKGQWGPLPLPQCLRVLCVDPGVIPNALRLSAGFLYKQQVTYECLQGYRIQNPALRPALSFSRTCQEDGTWTEGTFCDDINECEETDDICENGQFCMNTAGGFVCIPMFPYTCELQDRLNLCRNGVCRMSDDKAVCTCDEGFTGLLCETPTTAGQGLKMAIVAIVLVVLLILLLIIIYLIAARQRYLLSRPILHGPTYVEPKPGKKFLCCVHTDG